MSLSYSVFVKSERSILEVSSSLENIINSSFERKVVDEWEFYCFKSMGLNINLLEATDYEDDGDLKFSQYGYQIMIERDLKKLKHAHEWQTMASRVIGSMMSRELDCECIAVMNMQVLLGKYGPDLSKGN